MHVCVVDRESSWVFAGTVSSVDSYVSGWLDCLTSFHEPFCHLPDVTPV